MEKRVKAPKRRHGVWVQAPKKDCGDNVGKGHLPAESSDNLQRTAVVGKTKDGGRDLVWRMGS